MSPNQLWPLMFLHSRTLHRRQKNPIKLLHGRRQSNATGSRSKTAHYLAVLKFSESRLDELSHHIVRKHETNIFADLFAAGNLLSVSEHSKSGKASVVVYGADESTAVNDLVSVFLDDPLASSDSLARSVKERWQGRQDRSLSFEYSPEISTANSTVFLPSPLLSELPIQLIEIRPGSPSPDLVYSSDIPIFSLGDPYFTSCSLTFSDVLIHLLPPNRHSIIVVNASVSLSSANRIESQILRCFQNAKRTNVFLPKVLFVDIEKASQALEILRANTAGAATVSASEVQRYQDCYTSSGLPALISSLRHTLSTSQLSSLREDTAQSLVSAVYQRGQWAIRKTKMEAGRVHGIASDLRGKMIEDEAQVFRDVLGIPKDLDGEAESTSSLVAISIERAAEDVKVAMDSLSWWKLPVIADDISRKVNNTVKEAYTKELQNSLVFHSGRLDEKQRILEKSTNTQLSEIPTSFQSSLLQNTLAQLSVTPSHKIKSTTLLHPLHSRIHQLFYPTNRLHLSAQRAVVASFFGTFASGYGGFTLWMTSYLDGPTALGAGALGALLSLQWAISWWDKAKKRCWKDWKRVGEGLERDLHKTLQKVLSEQVFAVPDEACKGLERIVEKRRKDVGLLEDELRRLRLQIKDPAPPAERRPPSNQIHPTLHASGTSDKSS